MKNFVGASTEELFMYFLFIDEYKSDLFVKGNGGEYMPDRNEFHWYSIPPMLMRDLNINENFRDGDDAYSFEDHWQFLREMWKVGGHEIKLDYAKTVSKWGELQNKAKGAK